MVSFNQLWSSVKVSEVITFFYRSWKSAAKWEEGIQVNVPSRRGRQHSDTAGSAWLQPGSYHLAFVCPKRSCRALCPLAGGMLQKAQWETAREEGSEATGTGRVQIHRGTWECYSYCLFVLLKALQSLHWQKAWAALNPDLNNSRMSRVGLSIAHKQSDSFTRNFTQLKSPWSSNLVWITYKEGQCKNRSPCDWNSSWLNQTQPCWPRHKRVLYKYEFETVLKDREERSHHFMNTGE